MLGLTLPLLLACGPSMPHVLGQTRSDGSASCSTAIGDTAGDLRYTVDATKVGFQFAPNGRLARNTAFSVQVYTDGEEPETLLTLESDAEGYVELTLADLPQSAESWGLVIRDRKDWPMLELGLWPVGLDEPAILCAGHVDQDTQPLASQPFDQAFDVRAWTWNAEGLSVAFVVLDRDAGLTGVDYEQLAYESALVADEQASASLSLGTGGPNEVGGLELVPYAYLLDSEGERVGEQDVSFKLWIE